MIDTSFVAVIHIRKLNIKSQGYGRDNYEAMKTALLNVIEQMLSDEQFINPIKDSLKIFLMKKINETPKSNMKNINKILNEINEGELNNSEGNFNYKVTPELRFSIFSIRDQAYLSKLDESIKEKGLIINELEKMIIDMMNYNKVMIKYIKIIFRK